MLKHIHIETAQGTISGVVDPKFAEVLSAFVANFEERGEIGASVAVTLQGKQVVDLWGGVRAPGGTPWERDTVSVVYSSTKGATALCAHLAAEQGLLDFDARVDGLWPEYGCNGKESTRVGMMLDHTNGLPHVRTPVNDGDFYNYDQMIDLVAAQEPFWRPGSQVGYQALSFAWTAGELVHRATGKRLGKYFHDEIAKPLRLDFWIGLPTEIESRIAPVIPAVPSETGLNSRMARAARDNPAGPSALFFSQYRHFDLNTRAGRAAEIGSANGVTNARGLAGLYAAVACPEASELKAFGKEGLARMGRVSSATHLDAMLMIPSRFSLGFMKSVDNRNLENSENCSLIMSEAAFGHAGAGGSLGFADPEEGLSFGYTMNKLGEGILLNERGQSLVDATYKALGYRSNASGVWM